MSQWIPPDFPAQQLDSYVSRMFYGTSLGLGVIRSIIFVTLMSQGCVQSRLTGFFLVFNFCICVLGLCTLKRSLKLRNCIKLLYAESLNAIFFYQAYWLAPEYKLLSGCVAFAVIGSFYQLSFSYSYKCSIFLSTKQLLMWISMDIASNPIARDHIFATSLLLFHLLVSYAMLFRIYYILSKTRSTLLDVVNEQNRQVSALLESIPEGMLVMLDGKVLMFNKILGNLFDCRTEILVLQQLQMIPNLLSQVLHFLNLEGCQYLNFGIVSHGEKHLEWLGSKVQWGNRQAAILTCRDISELYRLQTLAQQESERKSAMMRSVSHELRTPMNCIKFISEELVTSNPDFEPEKLRIVSSCCNLMSLLVDEILDFTTVTSASFSLNKLEVNLQEVVTSCVNMLHPFAESKNLSIISAYDPDLPAIIHTDPGRLSQLIVNLLSNAIKYTHTGSVRVVVVACSIHHVKIIVEDTGIGIEPQRFASLFGENSVKALPTGGLGLFMSNQLAKLLGGSEISVTSRVGVGSAFSFTLLIHPNEMRSELRRISATAALAEIEENDVRKSLPVFIIGHFLKQRINLPIPEILIVDDFPFNRMVVRSILEKSGFFTQEAENGNQAIEKVMRLRSKGFHFRLIVMDIDMPELDGISATIELRKLAKIDSTLIIPPILGHSAYTSEADKQRCFDAGMQAFLPKPFEKNKALALISELMLPTSK